jgi:hypothetical protein
VLYRVAKAKKVKEAPEEVTEEKVIENWADRPDSDIYTKCLKFYPLIVKSYENAEEADEGCKEYWNIYNAQFDDNQMYQGNSKCYVPVVRDAINARAKRALKQNFPQKYKHVDAVGTDSQRPYPQLALLEHYIRKTKLKSTIRSMYIAGDVTGQWNLYVDWLRDVRNVSGMIKRNPIIEGLEGEAYDPSDEEDVLDDQEIIEEGPTVTDFATEDLAVIPPTCNDIERADVVSLKLRLSKDQVQKMVDDGIFIIGKDTDVSDWMDSKKTKEKINPTKARASEAGVKTDGTDKHLLVFEATARLEFEKGKKSLAYIYYAGESEILGIIKAPQWGQKRPTISAPVDRIQGSFRGVSKIEAVKWMQWNLNDFWNMGQDSAMYSLLPIVMTDPDKNPNYAMMVFGLAAVWPTDPNSTQFASFPQLWKDSVGMCQSIKAQIHESLEVNPMMMGQMPAGRKNAGAMGAQQQEQSVPILDHAERCEEEILNPVIERMFEYDCQFRDEALTIVTRGELGVQASMQEIEPQQWGERYDFQWCGTDYVLNMQRMQQQIATMNVLRGIPPQQLNGRKLDITPILEVLTDNVFGAELGGRILIDDRNKYTLPPEMEDEMLVNGFIVDVHEGDDDAAHLQEHQRAAKLTGDPMGLARNHMQAHMQQLQKKRQMAMGAQQPQPGQPGIPGGAAPGVAGTPRPGAQPAGPKLVQQPAGAIGPDQMPGQPGRG